MDFFDFDKMKSAFVFVSLLFISFVTFAQHTMGNLNYKNLQLPNKEIQHREKLTEKEFQDDLELLKYAIRNAYGAKGRIDSDIFRKVDSALTHIHFTASPKAMCNQIGQVLSIFPDHHLHLSYDGARCYKRQFQSIQVGENLNDSKEAWKGVRTKDRIYIIAISKFRTGEWPGFQEFVTEAQHNARAIIIDLRNNGGGDDTQGYKLAEMLAGQKIQVPYAQQIARQTPETLTIWGNSLWNLKKNNSDKHVIASLENYIRKNSDLMQKALSGQLDEFSVSQHDAEMDWEYDKSKGFQGTVYILQNKGTASSGESTIDFFEYFPNVIKVGTNTAGTISFGNIGWFVLPNSGIDVHMPTTANRYKDGRFIEFKGIKPDVALKDGQDAYEYVLTLLMNS